MRFVLLFALLGTGWAWAQQLEATAPWLTVYDETGQPKWEVRMERLRRTPGGWEGENVTVTLFLEGVPRVGLAASAIIADRYGREWTLSGDVHGEGEGFAFRCAQARWSGGLVLEQVEATGHELELRAQLVRWNLGQALELEKGTVAFAGWKVEFHRGLYELAGQQFQAFEVVAVGHGVQVEGVEVRAWPSEGRLWVRGAKLVRGT